MVGDLDWDFWVDCDLVNCWSFFIEPYNIIFYSLSWRSDQNIIFRG